MRTLISVIGTLLVALVIKSSLFVLPEGRQALIVQFGRVVGEPITEAGLKFKIPFVQNVRYYDKRILTWDGDDEQIPTKDKKYINVDTTARWRIKDPIAFLKTLINEDGARNKLNGIIDGITRDTISNHNLVEAVRNTNRILDTQAKRAEDAERTDNEELEIFGDIESVSVGREALSQIIIERARGELEPFGIELIDVLLRRIAYEKSVEEQVYDRMISERKRIAEKIRSVGKGEEAKILGRINRDLKEIQSVAYKRSQEIKGEADAKAIAIFAESLSRDPDFYRFVRTLEAYERTLADKGRLVLATDSPFLQLLEGNNP